MKDSKGESDDYKEREMIIVSRDNYPQEENQVNAKSLKLSNLVTKRGYYVLACWLKGA